MKIQKLETHDRLQHLQKDQAINLAQGCEDCLKKNALSLVLQQHSPYIYIFAHPRTHDDGITKRMLWQPRLSRPLPQTNSYLFRVKSGTDNIEICWMIPPREVWNQYTKGMVTENETVTWSINQFQNNRKELEANHPEDISEDRQRAIYRIIKYNQSSINLMDKLYLTKPTSLEEHQAFC